jgi:hypothetical protein
MSVSSISHEISCLRNEYLKIRLENELKECDNEERKKELTDLLYQNCEYFNKPTNQSNSIQTMFDVIDKYTYTKSWSKLLPQHKLAKFREYVTKIFPMSHEEIMTILEKNIDKITTKKHINYDQTNGVILSIPILKYTNDKGYYLHI